MELFDQLHFDDQIGTVDRWMEEAGQNRDETQMEFCLNLLIRLHGEAKRDAGRRDRCLRNVMDHYPVGSILDVLPEELPEGSRQVPAPVLMNVRAHMLQFVSSFWLPKPTARSVLVFGFLCAAMGTGEDGLELHERERDLVPRAVLRRVADDAAFTFESISWWLGRDGVPEAFATALGDTWMRRGGLRHMLGICRAEYLELPGKR